MRVLRISSIMFDHVRGDSIARRLFMRTLAIALLTAFGIGTLAHGQSDDRRVHIFMGPAGNRAAVYGEGLSVPSDQQRLETVRFWIKSIPGIEVTADQAVRDGHGYILSGNVRIEVLEPELAPK